MSGRAYWVARAVVLVGVVLLMVGMGSAQIPQKINYQGMITDSDTGDPLPGSHNMTFRIFDQESGGSALWTESQVLSANSDGVVSAILGSLTPVAISFDGEMWLEVEVDGDVLEPRRELVSVPYAFGADVAERADSAQIATNAENAEHAENADSLGGVPASSYVQDGHSLDADDGDPVDVVYVDELGKVGVGTTSPDADFHIYKDANEWVRLLLENPNEGNSNAQAVIFADDDRTAGITAYGSDDPENPNEMSIYNNRSEGTISLSTASYGGLLVDPDGRVGIGKDIPFQELDVNGDIQARQLYLGSSSEDGALEIYREGSVLATVRMTDLGDDGGAIRLREDGGQIHTALEPDLDPQGGGWLQVARSSSAPGVTIDGNYSGTENPRVSISGSPSSAVFSMNLTRNSSVVLPVDAISGSEMFDEPGVASARAHLTSGTAMALSNGFNTLAFRSIQAPAAGYALVIGSCQPTILHVNGTDSNCEFGVWPGTTFPNTSNQDCMLWIDDQEPSGYHIHPVTVHGLFEIASAGTYTYYFLANKGSGTITSNDVQLTVVYFPTYYGLVDPTFTSGEPSTIQAESEGIVLSREQQLAPEPVSADQVYRERIEREMAEMRAEIEALRQELDADPNRRRQAEEEGSG